MQEKTQATQAQVETTSERMLREYSIEGIEEHNRSLRWLLDTAERLGARIEVEPGESRWDSVPFEIRLNGLESGIQYRIRVSYRPRMAQLMSRRISEVDLSDEESIRAMLSAFQKMLDFDVYWYDPRKLDWERFCVIPKNRKDSKAWPFDRIVSLMEALNDDLGTALDIGMNTLRKELVESFPVAWFSGQTDPSLTFDKVSIYVSHLMDLIRTESQDEFEDVSNAFAALFGDSFREGMRTRRMRRREQMRTRRMRRRGHRSRARMEDE
ncbi:MAG: hypothetical protein QF377_02535 [Candidatus Thalassarchaeum sp.]|nr:hypothetical protein [Candidatus Thalassarchaeum sp.]